MPPSEHDPRGAAPAPGENKRKAQAIARGRKEAMRTRAKRIRRSVWGWTLALFVAAFLGVYAQLASGHDPALDKQTSTASTSTSAASSSASAQSAESSGTTETGSSGETTESSESAGSSESSSESSSGSETSGEEGSSSQESPSAVTTRQS